jgi:CopG family nickel-responsive transcriptional regulator
MPIISVQIDEDLLNRFNKIKDERGYSSKSKALRDSIVEFIQNYEIFEGLKGYRIIVICLIYPIELGLLTLVSDICEKYRNLIKTMMDWRIAEKKIEIILTIGEVELIKDFYNELIRIKDITASINEIIID